MKLPYILGILSALLLPMAAGTVSASAAGLLEAATTADLRAVPSTGSNLGALAARSRIAKLDLGELARHVAPLNIDTASDRIARARTLDGVITIELFPDAIVTFRRRSVDEIGDSGYAWVGDVDQNPLYYASLIVDQGQVTGHIQLLHRLFQIEPLGGGLHRVTELRANNFPPDDPGEHSRREAAPGQFGTVVPGTVTTIRVLVAFTKQAAVDAGGNAAIVNQIKQAVSLANVGYSNSKIPIKLVLAKAMSAGTYVEESDIAVDLDNLDGNNGAVLSAVRAQRPVVHADLVSLFRKSDPSFCGIGNLTDHPSAATRKFAFHVMNWTCISNLSFHHEMGHNMGLRHDRYVDSSVGVGYNHGFVNGTNGCRVRSVMAYNNSCSDRGFNCTRINYFSTQAFVVPKLPGVTTKACQIGVAKGSAKASDNAQRLRETRAAIGGYVADSNPVTADAH